MPHDKKKQSTGSEKKNRDKHARGERTNSNADKRKSNPNWKSTHGKSAGKRN